MGPESQAAKATATETGSAATGSCEKTADAGATRWLFAATGTGALVGAAWLAAGTGWQDFLPQNFAGTLLVNFGAGLLAAALLLAAWALTVRAEARSGIRRQRGAMAALAGLAVLCIPLMPHPVFSPVLGAALILLAFRTRDPRTAGAGFTALAASLALVVFPDFPGAALVLALVAAATILVAVQLPAGYSPR